MAGAAYATLAGHGTIALTTCFVSRRLFSVPYDWVKLFRTVTVVVIAMGTAQLLITHPSGG